MSKAKSSSSQRRRKEAARQKRRRERKAARSAAEFAAFDTAMLKQMAEDLRQKGFMADTEITFNPAGHRKMSELLEELIDPYLDATKDLEQLEKLVSMGTIAWNATLMSAQEQARFLDRVLSAVPPTVRPDFALLLRALMLRKVELFPNERRQIFHTQLTPLGDGYHLTVASSMHGEAVDDATDH
jgi:hypothetical protein